MLIWIFQWFIFFKNEFAIKINGGNKLTKGMLRLPRGHISLCSKASICLLEEEGDMSLWIFHSKLVVILFLRSVAAIWGRRTSLRLLPSLIFPFLPWYHPFWTYPGEGRLWDMKEGVKKPPQAMSYAVGDPWKGVFIGERNVLGWESFKQHFYIKRQITLLAHISTACT